MQLLGVLNVTPDSFSDGGRYLAPEAALAQAQRLWDEGADYVDVGAESTRPGAPEISADAELARLRPVFAGLAADPRAWSIDTQKPAVMQAALEAGAAMLNDVHALQAPGALEVAAGSRVPLVLMHRQGRPGDMQRAPRYADVVDEVCAFLERRREACLAAGIDAARLIFDPGIGFGKTLEHNLALLRALPDMAERLRAPLLVGVSRKSMFAQLLGLQTPEQRLLPSVLTAAICAARGGTHYLRVHDVAPTRQALRLWAVLHTQERR